VEQIQAAACGKTASQGGLNVPDVKKILAAPSVQAISIHSTWRRPATQANFASA
jgi:hypothetical protein